MNIILLTLILVIPLFVVCGLIFIRPSLKAGWKSYLGWEAVPPLQLIFFFALIGSVNWPYESKLLFPRLATDFVDSNLGPLLLTSAFGLALLASALLFSLRLLCQRLSGPNAKWYNWLPVVVLGLATCLLIMGSTSTILLGPAAMTMHDQMTQTGVQGQH